MSPLWGNFTHLWSSWGLLEFYRCMIVTTFTTMQNLFAGIMFYEVIGYDLFTRAYDGSNLYYHTKALMLYLFLWICSVKELVIALVQLMTMRFTFLTLYLIRTWACGFPNPNDVDIFLLFFTMKLINKKSSNQLINQGIEASLIFLWLLFLGQFHHGPEELLLRLIYHSQILMKSTQDSVCMDIRKEPGRPWEAFDLNHQPL